MAWSWRYENGDGQPVDGPGETFPSQADAESWVGQVWRELATSGVTTVTLVNDDKDEYRMSLQPAGDSMSYGRWDQGGMVIRRPGGAFRPSVTFLCIVAVFAVTGWMLWTGWGSGRFNVFLFVLAGWIVSLCLHEYAHALTGYFAGDVSVASRGYLTLNPLKYAHPVLSIVLPVVFLLLGGIGLPGGAVWIDHQHIHGRWKDTLISLAGPGTNVIFTLALVSPFALGVDTSAHLQFWAAVAFLAFLQLTASILNLMPVPGVDGGNALFPWLSNQYKRGFNAIAPYGMLLFLALLWQPSFNLWFFGLVFDIARLLGLPLYLYEIGWQAFQFWH